MHERVQRHAAPIIESPQRDARTERIERNALLRLVQAKLAVGPVGDRYEREADEVADRVTAVIQRMSSPGAVVERGRHRAPLRNRVRAPPRRSRPRPRPRRDRRGRW